MTTQETAELKVLIRWAKGIGVLVALSLFSAGLLWAAFKDLPEKVQQLREDRDFDRQVLRDFMLLACARDGLNITERAVCASYQVRP